MQKTRVNDSSDLGGIFVEKQVRTPPFSMAYEHTHRYCELFYLRSGQCVYTVNGVASHIAAGELFVVAADDFHRTRYEGTLPAERIVVCCALDALPDSFWEVHPDLRESLSRSGKVVLTKKGQEKLERLFEEMLEENAVPDRFSLEFLMLHTVAALLLVKREGVFVYEQIQQGAGVSNDIDEALRYIALNFALPLTLDEVARNVNLCPTYLSKKFKKVTNVTFKEYVNYIRIRQASQMLLTTDDSITKIAINCGFNSSNYFKDCFHRLNGVSPRDFRKQGRDPANGV